MDETDIQKGNPELNANKIIRLDSETELEIERKPGDKQKFCTNHCRRVLVNPEMRTIECRDCGQVVDPFDYIDFWAREGERRMDGLKGLEAKMRVATTEFSQLERRIDNLRAQLKRMGHPLDGWLRMAYKNALLNAQTQI